MPAHGPLRVSAPSVGHSRGRLVTLVRCQHLRQYDAVAGYRVFMKILHETERPSMHLPTRSMDFQGA